MISVARERTASRLAYATVTDRDGWDPGRPGNEVVPT
jgi:hypothetical protein